MFLQMSQITSAFCRKLAMVLMQKLDIRALVAYNKSKLFSSYLS